MSFKIPVSVDILQLPPLEQALWCYIILNCRREPEKIIIWAGRQKHEVFLKKGQMLLNMSEYARSLGAAVSHVKKSLEFLNKNYEKLKITRHPFGLIIEPLNYDAILKMKNTRRTLEEHSKNTQRPIYNEESVREREGGEEPHPLTEDKNVLGSVNLKASISLKKELGINSWVDSRLENQYSEKLSTLYQELGSNEFTKRFRELAADAWHRKRFNEIKYVYEQMVAYIPPIDPY